MIDWFPMIPISYLMFSIFWLVGLSCLGQSFLLIGNTLSWGLLPLKLPGAPWWWSWKERAAGPLLPAQCSSGKPSATPAGALGAAGTALWSLLQSQDLGTRIKMCPCMKQERWSVFPLPLAQCRSSCWGEKWLLLALGAWIQLLQLLGSRLSLRQFLLTEGLFKCLF